MTRSRSLVLALVLALGIALGRPPDRAAAAIGAPVDLGSNEADGTVATSLAITTTAAVPAGASIVVVALSIRELNISPTSATCTDSAGDSFTTDVTGTDSLTLVSICSAHQVTNGLSTGGTITVTWTGGAAPWNQRARAFTVTGLASNAFDKSATATGTSTAASSGVAGTTAQADELLVGAIDYEGNNVSSSGFAAGTNGTANTCATSGTPSYTALPGVGSDVPSLFGEYCAVSATGAYAAQASFTFSSAQWIALLATYKAAPPPPPTFPVGGSFVVGDLSATVGSTVTFSGAQWSSANRLSGGSAPASFKGFETSATAPVCGGTWTTNPGNSAGPPASVPPLMGVIVSSHVTKSGRTISGDIQQVVVVRTNPGYAPSPGHAGTGTVVAVVPCG